MAGRRHTTSATTTRYARLQAEREARERLDRQRPVLATQAALWPDQEDRDIRKPAYMGTHCYLCGDKAEGRCDVCGRPLCWICGANKYAPYAPYECESGDKCPHARRHQWQRQGTMIRRLTEYSDWEFSAEVLRDFIAQAETVWGWAVAGGWTGGWQKEQRKELDAALRKARQRLPNAPKQEPADPSEDGIGGFGSRVDYLDL